ncbi:MAG: hypothetical protein E6Q33_07105 [Neisseriales bacterium]|nr:MAG: hypothetical protein E6Q33_07105 [Neisseriales bacterium]
MKNITINQTINLLSTTAIYLIMIFAGILFGKSVWWLANPLGYDTYNNIISRNFDSNKLAQTIINRAPFGMVTEEKAPVPTIAEQIKVVGVYAAGPNNSVAFITVNGKNSIAVIGDSVLEAKVKAIKPDGVVFLAEKQDVTINLTSSSASPNSPSSSSGNNGHTQSPSGANGYIPSSSPPPSNNQNNSNQQTSNDNSATSGNQANDSDSIAEKRRKMIEAFQKQNAGGNGDNNSGQQN